uniref:Mur ligase central domain-containing protein n=1 Tax=Chlamydomonas leiostraca TaxID=1034604 RepID=A0A7S0WRN5_9CHLO
MLRQLNAGNLEGIDDLLDEKLSGFEDDLQAEAGMPFRQPTPSGEASTSGAPDPESKYPEPPVRVYFIADLFGKAAYYDAAIMLEKEFPQVAVYGLQASPDKIIQGDLYCCMPEHLELVPSLVKQAVEAGASALLLPEAAQGVEGVKEAIPASVPVLYVPVVDDTASRLAVAFYDAPSRELLVVSVSGSRGKTTTSWLIRGVLEEMEQLTGMIGSVEYALADDRLDEDGELWAPREKDPAEGRESSAPFHVTPYAGRYTTPGTTPSGLHVQKLLGGMRDRGAACAVVEYGPVAAFNGCCDWVEPTVVVHTGLDFSDHKDEEGQVLVSRELLLEAALEPFERLADADTQAAVVNLDDDPELVQAVLRAAQAVNCVTYSVRGDADADVVLEEHRQSIWEAEMIIRTPEGRIEIIMPLLGEHNASNILAAVATGIALKVPLKQIVAGIEAVEVIPGRCEVVDEGQKFSVIVDSADTPQSLRRMLEALEGARNIITVVGCRGDEDPSQRPAMAAVAHELSSTVIFTNDSPRTEEPQDIVSDMVAGLPDHIVNRFKGYVYFPFQDQGHVPLWFEPYLQSAQRATKRYVMEDRFSAIRAAIGTAGPEDVVLIAGRGHRDCMEYGGEAEGEVVRGWLDDRAEARSALSKLAYLEQLGSLDRKELPWGKALSEMESVMEGTTKEQRGEARKKAA